ncbi:hypothetical protein [Pseudoalteromonas luteoviolacea]|uniref:Uncharacterized protein n=1 Tax=Pseudoalteromonas luteoviolacea S4060-1 TaxID=1365257 RepID=A0A162CAZ7_9GAMM|nr:hypothetical protein [Pseudoalteromonas luteoviolacea]KZN65024.1 hypothetical protein N478_03180 [Pseudoalteromonas luteoviolacea S4060-1]
MNITTDDLFGLALIILGAYIFLKGEVKLQIVVSNGTKSSGTEIKGIKAKLIGVVIGLIGVLIIALVNTGDVIVSL